MSTDGFARTGVDPVSRCLLGCGTAVAAEGQVAHRQWHAEIGRLAIGLERLRNPLRTGRNAPIAPIDLPHEEYVVHDASSPESAAAPASSPRRQGAAAPSAGINQPRGEA